MADCCVKVTNISRMVKNENLKDLFSCCGEIRNMKYCMDKNHEQICIVEFYEASNTEMAELLNGTEVGDKKLVVTSLSAEEHEELFSEKKTQTTQELSEYERACKNLEFMMKGPNGEEEANDEVKRTIYLGNISKTCTTQDVRAAFAKIGPILYIKFSNTSKADFRYCFVEFETEEAARMAFTLHGFIISGQPVKIGKAHNPIFKDDPNDKDNPLWTALQAAKRVEKRVLPAAKKEERERRGGEQKDKDRKRRRRRRRRRERDRDRSRSYEREEPEEEPKMFFDGYQWHFNDKVQDVETHVTSVIRDVGGQTTEKDVQNIMQDAAAASLKKLKLMKTGMGMSNMKF